MAHAWGYGPGNGPNTWHRSFPIALGDHQSPIDIKADEAKYDQSLQPLNISYDPSTAAVILNNGHAFNVEFEDSQDKSGPDTWADYFPSAKGQNQSPIELHTRYIKHDASLKPWTTSYRSSSSLTIVNDGTAMRVMFDGSSVLKDGPLTGTYRLMQLQFHWGSSDDQGSEHVIDGLRYAGEIQFVHWNSKYENIREAKKNPDGVVIISVFLKIGKAKPAMKAILEALGCIKAKGRKAHFTDFDPSILFPASRDYWTYQGSCTTPPCEEGVTWLLLREPITLSSEQMEKFRSLHATMDCEIPIPLVNNYRPTQPLNGREVRASFD